MATSEFDHKAYADNIRAQIAKHGVRFSDDAHWTRPCGEAAA